MIDFNDKQLQDTLIEIRSKECDCKYAVYLPSSKAKCIYCGDERLDYIEQNGKVNNHLSNLKKHYRWLIRTKH